MDFLNSFFQNVKDKLTSPFFGTLGFIFIIHHWEFWYTLFNFDQDCTRPEKIAILSSLGNKEFGTRNIVYDIVTAIFIMLIGYGIVMATRTLSLAVDFRFMPWITGKIINSKVVERSVHEKVVQERDEYSEKYEEQRKNVRNLSKDYDKQTDQIDEKNKLLNTNTDDISDFKKEITSLGDTLSIEKRLTTKLKLDNDGLKTGLETLKTKLNSAENQNEVYSGNINNLLNVLLDSNSFKFRTMEDIPPVLIKKINNLQSSGDWQKFKQYYNFEMRGGSIGSDTVNRMQELGLANKDKNEKLTPLGTLLGAYEHLFNT